jgi:hypothetical protein
MPITNNFCSKRMDRSVAKSQFRKTWLRQLPKQRYLQEVLYANKPVMACSIEVPPGDGRKTRIDSATEQLNTIAVIPVSITVTIHGLSQIL